MWIFSNTRYISNFLIIQNPWIPYMPNTSITLKLFELSRANEDNLKYPLHTQFPHNPKSLDP